ncbi:uncharacterized protein LOC132740160 [Ruditapes philippinarum]|uniref:uncharacterized protein LOC132740160 n=1 Tax=Ruditapes philippinarum TaxID=129788 RepID=UPI00295AB8C3|nr:uncharacterized protein LOC132740160 [Ruditapes philippinarum]
MNVESSAELERRLSVLARRNSFKYESEPIVDYANFAIKTLGVSNGTAILEGNTLNQSVEIIYCEFNINFGVKTASEGLATWKREAEAVFNSRKSGSAIEIFKTLGERTVHLMTEMTASSLDEILFLVPFAQEIPNTLGTRCKVARKF